MSRPFDFSQMPSDGIVILPELPPNPAIKDALTVDSIGGDGRVQLKFSAVSGGGTSGDYLLLTGGTLTGPLVLAADPVLPLGAATMAYVDAKAGNYLALAGGTLTGPLTLAGAPTVDLHSATKGYVDSKTATAGTGTFLPLAGGTLTGALLLSTSLPTAALEAASKDYVDEQVAMVAAVGIATLQYNASTNTTAANPGNGSIRWNTIQMYDATQLYISNKAADTTDWAHFFRKQVVGTKVAIQLKNDSTKICRFFITGAVVDNSGWMTIPVNFLGAGGYSGMPFAGGANVVVAFLGTTDIQARNEARLQSQWVNASTVSDDTVWWWDMPYAGTVSTLKYFTGNGSFNVAIKINGVTVTGLSAVAVSSSTPATATATALNVFAKGDNITAVITGSTGSPTDALLSLAVTWS